jgi:hypothetical protein
MKKRNAGRDDQLRSVATSRRQRLLCHLYSTKNLVGSAAGLAGLGLYFTGLVGELWPVVGGLYGVGALATPPTRTLDLHSGLDPANLNRAMATHERRLRGRAPADVLAAVGPVHGLVREVLEDPHAFPPGSPDAFVAKLGEVLDAIAKGDSDRLLAHGRFLEDRFGRPEVELR